MSHEGTVYVHGPKASPCPGSKKPPRPTAGDAAVELARTIEELPVRHLNGKPAVLLSDLTGAVDELFERLDLPPRGDLDG